MRLATFLLLVPALVGCAVGPSTRATQPAAPALSGRAPGATSSSSRAFLDSLTRAREADQPDTAAPLRRPAQLALDSAGDLAWLQVLRDSQLVALVRTGIAHNRDLQTAAARVREYRAEVGVARADLFPQVDLNLSASTNQDAFGGFAPMQFDAVRITSDLQWELDFWGRIRRQTEAAAFDWRAQEQDRRATLLSLVSDIATAYLELLENDQNLTTSQQTLESRRATLELARRRFEQGVISDLDVSQFESAVAAPAALVAEFTRQRIEKENRLSVLVGSPPGSIARGGRLEAAVTAVTVPDSLPASLVVRRPDVLRAQHDWQAATARVGAAVADRLPTFFVTGEYGTQRPDFHQLFESSAETYSVGAGVSIPLFRGGKLLNQERAARARADQAKAQYQQTVLIALGEASDALAGVRLNRDQIAAQQTEVRALRRAYTTAQRRYERGISSYLDVLDAQRSLFDAELSLTQSERQYLAATVQLYKALGGGWTS
jgi:outer membrane protein, multidrug efflux system